LVVVVKKLALGLGVAFWAALVCHAAFDAGLAAYDRGDYAAAAREWQPIAERGDANAQYNMGLLFSCGQGVPQDNQKAAEWYKKAAEQGVAAAQYNLAVLIANGAGVPKDSRQAAEWFRKAADNGIAPAAANLADLEYDTHDYADAQKWYRKAAESGIASAFFGLGLMYDLGQGVPQDYQQATDWYRKAAEAGYAPAMTNLGILYYNAQGEKRNLPEAYAWLARAQTHGDPRAAELLKTTGERMSPKDVRRAQGMVGQWQPSAKSEPKREQAVETAKLFKQPEIAPASGEADRVAPETAAPSSPQPNDRQDIWTGVDRVIAVGDIHGDYEQFVKVLQSADLIDNNANWIGGKAHLVQTGDVVDRGPDSRAIMDLLMKLEKQAVAAGGGVHALIGNHEAMDIYGDLRYVSSAEFAAFQKQTAGNGQFVYNAEKGGVTAKATPSSGRAGAGAQIEPGYSEWREAFGLNGVYGRWIRSHNAVIKIDRTLFVHAGISSKYADWSLERINEEVRQELNDPARIDQGIVTDDEGPLWTRDLAEGDEARLAPLVAQLLEHFDVDRIVIGHSYADAAITPRFGGKVLLIDVGLSRIYDNRPKLACLEIDRYHVYALHRGRGIELPSDEDGPDMLRYLKQAAALDPQPSPLEQRIRRLEQGRSTPVTTSSSQ
jgi:TPR repeat protein